MSCEQHVGRVVNARNTAHTKLRRVSAPGKGFLFGEYLALEGGPAAVVALSRRVTVTVARDPAAPRGGPLGWRWCPPGGKEQWATLAQLCGRSPDGDLVAAVVQTLVKAGHQLWDGVTISSDVSELATSSGTPLGLGSSAASAAALTAAFVGPLEIPAIESLAIDAHRLFQANRGSGYDVRAACRGGINLIRGEACAAVTLPKGLALRWLSGHRTLSTPSALGAWAHRSGQDAEHHQLILSRLRRSAEDAAEALVKPDITRLISALRAFGRQLDQLGALLGVEIVTSNARVLAKQIQDVGGVVKPSGAGGDELLVLLCPEEVLTDVRRIVEVSPYDDLGLVTEIDGLRGLGED